jgi:hypothetical protein
MKLRRSPIFLFVFLLCPAYAAAADATFPPCEVEQPGVWEIRVDKEPSVKEPADGAAAVEPGPVERERVAPTLKPLAVPTPLANLSGDALFRQAYADVYRILSAENECSRFYGGAAPAAYVFNQLAGTFKSARIDGGRVAGKMGGGAITVTHVPSGLKFRLFEKAVLNTAGAFYRREGSNLDERVPRVGSFAPDTRGARALILLHELGHLVKGGGGRWLLADDGDDPSQSERNTELIEEHCAGQLRALGARTQPRPAEVAESPAREPAGRDSPDH